VIERESAGGDDAVDMGMKREFLLPGMQHAEEADLSPEMAGVTSHFQKGFFEHAKAVGACRTFNYDVYKKLGELGFVVSEPLFRQLTSFSFVNRIQQHGETWFQVHQLLRRILRDSCADLLRRADEVLTSYYEQAGVDGTVDAIYHRSRLDWQAGITDWVKTLESAVDNSQFVLCRALRKL